MKTIKWGILNLVLCLALVTGCNQKEAEETINNLKEVSTPITEEVKLSANSSEAFGVDLSKLSKDEVTEKLNNNKDSIEKRNINIVGNDDIITVNLGDIMYKIDVTKTVENIMNDIKPSEVFNFDNLLFEEKANEINSKFKIEPVNASMSRQNGAFIITDGANGRYYNKENFNDSIQKVFVNDSSEIILTYDEVEPKYNRAFFEQSQNLLGTYTSKYNVSATERNKNLARASANINDVVLLPGEIFSTNAHFGETTIANGYAVANVIVNNELVEGLGGGVCQISSTLYNAVLKSEIEVVERLNHSLKVSYMDYGFDATLANPYIDFKFRNNTEFPIYVEAGINNGNATVSIYGKETRSPNREIKFYNVFLSSVKAEVIEEEDPTLLIGERVVDVSALDGVKYAVYKDIYENGVKVNTIQINTSNYSPKQGKVRIGTKEPEIREVDESQKQEESGEVITMPTEPDNSGQVVPSEPHNSIEAVPTVPDDSVQVVPSEPIIEMPEEEVPVMPEFTE